jgi:hypothetical protein
MDHCRYTGWIMTELAALVQSQPVAVVEILHKIQIATQEGLQDGQYLGDLPDGTPLYVVRLAVPAQSVLIGDGGARGLPGIAIRLAGRIPPAEALDAMSKAELVALAVEVTAAV